MTISYILIYIYRHTYTCVYICIYTIYLKSLELTWRSKKINYWITVWDFHFYITDREHLCVLSSVFKRSLLIWLLYTVFKSYRWEILFNIKYYDFLNLFMQSNKQRPWWNFQYFTLSVIFLRKFSIYILNCFGLV